MIESILRENILRLQPYSSARDEFTGKEGVFLDANENPYGNWNRYPDPYQKELKEKLAQVKGVAPENLFIGNGSDEVIDLLMRLVCEPGRDKIITFPPTYGMYQVSAGVNDVEIIKVPLTASFQIDFEALKLKLEQEPNVKILFVCSPNNPTANSMANIEQLCHLFNGLVVVDEAYIEFSEQESLASKVNDFENLVVSQTFSKAWALASVRVGIAISNPNVIAWINRIKPPYNVSGPNQQEALRALERQTEVQQEINQILAQRTRMEDELASISFVKKIYPSDANFLLIEVDDADQRYAQLIDNKVIVRNRHKLVPQSLRITIGTPEENTILLQKMRELS